ncbi:hypothetical protein [Nocardioides sp. GXQ0305]|uniref:hypothetical protein n=1 Tax=Nocardioides sp. GXQ0305 TaxID=3423912 RepID=UPI003D7C9D72
MRNRWVVVGAVVLVVAVAAATVVWWRAAQTPDLRRAVDLAPAASERMTWTDWAGIRDRLGSDVGPSSDRDAVAAFLDEAYEADLSPMSSLLASTEAMQESYGFSPASLEWELLTQSGEGAAVLMQLPEDTDLDALSDRLEGLGYRRPDEDTGVWQGGRNLLPTIGTLTPELQYLALDPDRQLVVASDTEAYAEVTIDAVTGEGDRFDGLDEVVDAVGEPLAAAVYSGDVVCGSLAMGHAAPADQDQARELLAAAGEVDPLTGFAMARGRDGLVRVAMSFEEDDQARTNADTRARLASGPAPGQGGDFADRFRLGEVTAEGSVVTMELDPVEGSYVLSDLSSGPVLFATC